MVSFEDIKNNEAVRAYIKAADDSLCALGYTEHSFAHVTRVADMASRVLLSLGHSAREAELAKIAGYLHDIGNLVNREEHSQSGAVIAFRILDKLGMPPEEIAAIVTAIGNHDEGNGVPVSALAAALIIADKSDVRRTRVRNDEEVRFDIHDRVNFSVERADVSLDTPGVIELSIDIDTEISSVTEYFEIFLGRMLLCRRAAEKLGVSFSFIVNGQKLL